MGEKIGRDIDAFPPHVDGLFRGACQEYRMPRGPDREVTREEVARKMRERAAHSMEPWTANELAKEFDVSTDTIYNRLKELYETGRVDTKKTGARARVWWVTEPDIE